MWNILFGILLIIHGLIFVMFLLYVKVPEKEEYFGWSRKSWVLDKFLNNKTVYVIGLVLWASIILSFTISGILILSKVTFWRTMDIIASFISLFAFILFWNELKPKKHYFVLGPIIAIINIIALLIVKWPLDNVIFG